LLISERADYDAHTALFDNMTTLLGFQKEEEDRISRRFGDPEKYSQMEKADVFTGNLDFLKNISPSSRIIYGLAFAYNRVNSTARYTNIDTGTETPAQTRYPDGGSYTFDYAAYLGYQLQAGTKYTLAGGLRYSRNMLHSDFTSDFIQLPFNAVDIRNGAVTGSLSAVFHPDESFKISLMASTGFRNPNVDDYGKVRAKDGFVTVPSGGLGQEYTYNLEAGITKVFSEKISLSGAVYITWLDQAIVRADYTYQGKDSLEYDGEMYRMITNVNADKAMIRGVSANLSGKLSRHLEMRSTLNVQEGKDLSNDVPLPHIPPVFGRTELRWQQKRFGAGAWVEYYGWKRLKDMSPYGEDNEEEATQYGYPAWYTLNLQVHYDIGKNVTVQAGLANLTDNYYKVFSSGVSAPGRSFNLSLRATF
jgi:hemoglobin/transferrin/lactoferrin receptor protein